MDENNSPLKVALHGMDERSCKVMGIYLQGPCKGIAVVVNDDADIDIFNVDTVNAGKLLDEHLSKQPHKPIIVLSFQDRKHEKVLHVRKPITINDMIASLEKARSLLGKSQKTLIHTFPSPDKSISDNKQLSDSDKKTETTVPSRPIKQTLKPFVTDAGEQKKTYRHRPQIELIDKGFDAFIGNVPGIDVNDPKQFSIATYNPKDYFQSHVVSAYKVCQAKGKIRQLNSGWSPLLIFPHSQEVWLDADDNKLRAFAGLTLNSLDIKISISPPDPGSSSLTRGLEKFHDMDAFLWKLACWASKGRYPDFLDIKRPVYLKSWPNFTRLLITPHALRISALLIQGPRTLPNVAEVLNIKPQYVFVFISAACALNLAGQARREVDELFQPPEIQPNKSQGLMSRIISQLGTTKA